MDIYLSCLHVCYNSNYNNIYTHIYNNYIKNNKDLNASSSSDFSTCIH